MTDARALLRGVEARRSGTSPAAFIPQRPTPKQLEFVKCDAFEALFGGAAGPGKSSALLMSALNYVHVPGYAAILFRRTFSDLSLPGAIMDRAGEWLRPTAATWNDNQKRWTFPSGATLSFGYLNNAADRYRYQSSEFQFVGFDELTQFPRAWYDFLLTRIRRREGFPVPLRARGASNPGGLGHEWVRKHFVDPASREDRVFIPAVLTDNPHIDQGAYRKTLEKVDPTLRAQLLEGIWIRDSNGLVYRFTEADNTYPVLPEGKWTYVLSLDFGFNDSTAFVVLAFSETSPTVYVVESEKHTGMIPSEVAERVQALGLRYDFEAIIGDTGGLGKGYAEEARKRFYLPIIAAKKSNKRGYIDLLNGDLARGLVKVLPGNGELVTELSTLPWTEDRMKPAEGFEDHLADALLYGWRACRGWAAEAVVDDVPKDAASRAVAEMQASDDAFLARAHRESTTEWWNEGEGEVYE